MLATAGGNDPLVAVMRGPHERGHADGIREVDVDEVLVPRPRRNMSDAILAGIGLAWWRASSPPPPPILPTLHKL